MPRHATSPWPPATRVTVGCSDPSAFSAALASDRSDDLHDEFAGEVGREGLPATAVAGAFDHEFTEPRRPRRAERAAEDADEVPPIGAADAKFQPRPEPPTRRSSTGVAASH